MLEVKKCTLLLMDFQVTIRIELLQKIDIRQPSLQKWDPFSHTVMPFRLKNAPAMFSRVVISSFKEFIHKLLEVYFDDWTIFRLLKYHIASLRLMLDKCRQHHISLNLKKCIFCAPFGILLGHIVCKQGLMVDPTKIAIIVNLPPWILSNNCALHLLILVIIGNLLKDMLR